MFGKVKSLFGGKKDPPKRTSGTQLAMPLFASKDAIVPESVVKAWSNLFPGKPPLEVIEADGVATYAIEGRTLMAIHIPVAVPKGEALEAVRSSWMWQEPDDAVRDHCAHAIVTAFGSDDPMRGALDVARLSAAMLKAGRGVGLYWGNSRQVHTPRIVESFVVEDEPPPVPLWVGITISAESQSGPFSAATHGLEALGHKELEVLGTRMGIGAIRTTLSDVALYLLRQGPVLKHGQTFGPTANDRWTIRHARSALVDGRDAIVLGIP